MICSHDCFGLEDSPAGSRRRHSDPNQRPAAHFFDPSPLLKDVCYHLWRYSLSKYRSSKLREQRCRGDGQKWTVGKFLVCSLPWLTRVTFINPQQLCLYHIPCSNVLLQPTARILWKKSLSHSHQASSPATDLVTCQKRTNLSQSTLSSRNSCAAPHLGSIC